MNPPITILTLWVTNKCNMDCQYCYVEKKGVVMSMETARKAIDMVFSHQEFGKNTLTVQFFGGEPLLAQGLIEEVVDYCNFRKKEDGKKCAFSFTTNGTLLNDDNLKFLKKNRFTLMISQDGPPHVQNRRRPMADGSDSSKKVESAIEKVKEYFGYADIRMTVHPDDPDMAENIFSIISPGIRRIIVAPVNNADWTKAIESGRLLGEFKKMADMIIKSIRKGIMPPVNTFRTTLNSYLSSLRKPLRGNTPCAAGSYQIAVAPDGTIIPCQHWFSHSRYRLGDCDAGINPDRRKFFLECTKEHFPYCRDCECYDACQGPCMALSLNCEGDVLKQNLIGCTFTKYWFKTARYVHSTLNLENNHDFKKMISNFSVHVPTSNDFL